MPALAREVAVGIAIEARVCRLDAPHHLVEVDGGPGLVFLEIDQQRIRLHDLRADRVARGDQVLDVGVEGAVPVEEFLLGVDPPVDLGDERGRQFL